MKNAALAVLLLSVSASAQNRAAEIDFQNTLTLDDSQLAKAAQNRAAVERTLVAMNDGPEAGGRVVSFIRDRGIEISVKTQAEAVKTVVVNGRVSITLSDTLPAYPRVYGVLIAKEIAAQMLSDMPACAERSYMRRATAGRVWTELGGEPAKLPVIEPLTGDKVPAASDEITLWTDKGGVEWSLEKIGQAEKLASIPEMADNASGAEKAKLDQANARFVAFLIDEKQARKDAGLR